MIYLARLGSHGILLQRLTGGLRSDQFTICESRLLQGSDLSAAMTTLLFRPWARTNIAPDQGALQDVLARVNVERGHFRDITEAGLLEEVASTDVRMQGDSENEDDDEDDNERNVNQAEWDVVERAANKSRTREELFKAKFEMLQHVQAANNDVMILVDYISLLQSKDAPTQATNTISPSLKSTTPLGSLGVDIWQRMQPDKTREVQDDLLAANVRMKALQESADSLLTAASRLHDEVEKETRYWDRMLSITGEGWNVCRLPGLQHRLGITYGFSESLSEFSRRGVAALTTNSSGNIIVEHGVGSKRQSLHVFVRRGSIIIGSSQLPPARDQDDTHELEHQIREARDSLFDTELYREMTRESRSMASMGVQLRGGGIHVRAGDIDVNPVEVVFELLSMDDTRSAEPIRTHDSLASAMAIAARLLLSQAHRERLKRRAEVPAPLSTKSKEDRPLLPILRPILAFLMHHAALQTLNLYLDNLQLMLFAAGIKANVGHANFSAAMMGGANDAGFVISNFLRPWTSVARLTVIPDGIEPFSMAFEISTTLAVSLGPVYTLQAPEKQPINFANVEHLRKAANRFLASSLIRAVASVAEGEWKYHEREAAITKLSLDQRATSGISAAIESFSCTLTLRSRKETLVWKAGEASPDERFWSAWKRLI